MGSICYYDLETTGLNPKEVEIISIGAISDQGNMGKFEVFMNPRGPIDPRATRVHGMSKDQYGRLVNRNNRVIRTADMDRPGFQPGFAGLEMFLNWLHQADCRFLVRFYFLVKYR